MACRPRTGGESLQGNRDGSSDGAVLMAFLNPITREMRLGSGVMDWRWLLNQLNRRQRQRRSVH